MADFCLEGEADQRPSHRNQSRQAKNSASLTLMVPLRVLLITILTVVAWPFNV